MRIAVNGWFAGQLATGSGQYLAGLLSWLPEAGRGHEFVLVLPTGQHAPPMQTVGATAGWQVLCCSTPLDRMSRNLAKVWFEQVTFPRACKRLGAHVALVPYWGSPQWSPCPCLVTVHDIIPRLLPAYRGGPLHRAYVWLVAHTARRARVVLTDSEASRRDIIANLSIPPQRVHAVHLAVDPAFRPVTDESRLAQVRAKYGLPAPPFWLYLGGFDTRKNLTRLLAAYAQFVQRLAGSVPPLVLAGTLPARDSDFSPDPRVLAQELHLAGSIYFSGWVDEADKPVLYSMAQAAFFLSTYEGFGLPVLEAQACGCPVITSAGTAV